MSWQPLGSDGETATADPGTVTVGIVRSDGTDVVAAGSATTGTTTAPRVSPVLTVADMATPDLLTATWKVSATTVATTHLEIVGGVYFTIPELRDAERELADSSNPTTAALVTIRTEVETSFESWTNLAMVPRFTVAKVTGYGMLATGLFYPRSLRWARRVESDGTTTALTAADLAQVRLNDSGVLVWPGWCGQYELGIEHGLSAPPPDGKRMALLYARIAALRAVRGISHAAQSYTTPDGQVVSYDPDVEPTNYKIINEFLRRKDIDHRLPGLA